MTKSKAKTFKRRKGVKLYIFKLKGGGQLSLPLTQAKELINNLADPVVEKVKETIPEIGTHKFHVSCQRLGIYTNIGADNRHHAANKATKLFGPHWTSIASEFQATLMKGYDFCTVKQFNELVRTLQN